jgi:alcohol dehydrogenase
MRAVIVETPNVVKILEIEKPTPSPYQALVKTEIACLCNATDGKLVAGHFPGVEDYPLALGHESAGTIVEVGDNARNFKLGDKAIGGLVFDFAEDIASGWGGFCEYVLVTDHDAMVEDGVADEEHAWFECYEIHRTVPADIPLEEAVLLCTWREVYGGFGDFNLQPGQDVLIFGAGPVGLSFAKFGKLLGLGQITIVDPLPEKREKALAMGADLALTPEEVSAETFVKENANRFDRIIDAVGNEAIINAALPLIKLGGSVCVYGVLGQSSITLNHGTGPYNFNLLMHQWPTRERERAAMEPLCEWIREGKLTAAEFATHDMPLEKINDALQAVRSGSVIKLLLRY